MDKNIEIKLIDREHKQDINIQNEPFRMTGRIKPSYVNGSWSYETEYFDGGETCFPDENYDFDQMSDSTFIGAYDSEKCVGLAIMQPGFFRYMYLCDLKVGSSYRRKGIAGRLIDKAGEVAKSRGYNGIWTIGQDNNPGACLFYLKQGFHIGGLDTNVYKGTKQEGKSDIFFYLDLPENQEEI